ncbi:MAG TPA: hypothetical protein VFN35_29955 [Ktedonobacteraceae bacterium]|nr:hypothetical protein [Ktedonobacteraceae bacterium]
MNNYPSSPYPEQSPLYSGSQQAPAGYPQNQPVLPYSQIGLPPSQSPSRRLQTNRPPTRSSKKHLALWIGLIILLSLLVGSGSYYYFQMRSTPQKTIQAYCDALKNNDAQALYNTLTPELQTQTSVSRLQQGLRLLNFLTDGFRSCTFNENSIRESDPTATASITLVPNQGPSTTPTIRLKEEDGQWRIQDNTSIPG